MATTFNKRTWAPGERARISDLNRWEKGIDDAIDVVNSMPQAAGDMVGPSGATDGHFARFDTTTGKKLKDGTIGTQDIPDLSSSYATAGHNHDSSYVAKNNSITGASKCKITYDAKGLVTSGADLGTGDIPDISGTYAVAAKGVTSGDSHDHTSGHGAQIAYSSLGSPPTLGNSAPKDVGTTTGTVAAGDHTHDYSGSFAPIGKGVTNGDSHDHNGGDGAQVDHTGLSNKGTNTHAQIDTHISVANPAPKESFRRTGATRERWYTMALTGTALTVSTALTSGRFYAIPFVCPKACTVDRMAVNCTTLVSSGKLRLGIYTDLNGEPDQRVIDAGEVDTSGTGVKTISISQALSGGTLYWLVALSNSATHAFQTSAIAAIIDVIGFPATLPTAHTNYLYAAQTYGALPQTFPTVTAGTGLVFPLIYVRLSA